MHCSRVQNLLSAYCDYQLTGAEMLEIREHLGECHGCAREHASLRQVRQLLRALPTVEADRPFTPKVLDARPRLKFDLPWWYYEAAERIRTALFRFRGSACHLATGMALGLAVMSVSALQTPPSPNAARALVPTEIRSEPARVDDMLHTGAPSLAPPLALTSAPAGFSYYPNPGPSGFVVTYTRSRPMSLRHTGWNRRYGGPLSLELNGYVSRH